MVSRKLALNKETLPPLKQGFVRLVHLTKARPDYVEEIIKNGLDYSRHGMLQSTARWWAEENQVQYSCSDSRFSGPGAKAIVMDVPAQEIRLHNDVVKSPGIVPSKYLIGVIDSKKEE